MARSAASLGADALGFLHVTAQCLYARQHVPKLFDLHLDSVIGLGQLFGQQFGQTRVKRRKGRYLASCG